MTVSTVSIACASKSVTATVRVTRRVTFTRLTWSIALLLAFATPLTFAASGPGVLPGDVAVANALHGWFSSWLSGPIAFANVLGRAPVAIVISACVAMLLGYRRWFSEAALVGAAWIAWVGNALLKTLADSPRPTANLVRISENADGLGFPSGHVMGITVLLGALFVIATTRITVRPLRRVAQLGTLAMLVLTGIARIEVGAHWPSDVLGGYLWGTLLLLAIVSVQSNWSTVLSIVGNVVTRMLSARRRVSPTR